MPTTSSTLLRNIFFPAQLLEIGRSLWPEGGANVAQSAIMQLIDGEQFRLACGVGYDLVSRCEEVRIVHHFGFEESELFPRMAEAGVNLLYPLTELSAMWFTWWVRICTSTGVPKGPMSVVCRDW